MRRVFSTVILIIVIIVAAGAIEYSFGRTPFYKYGPVAVWSGNINSNANSQQIADPYSFTHIIHGVAFYGVLRLVAPEASIATRLVAAITAESGWEVLENTDWVVNKYREATISLDYYGDSILNSVFDILFCIAGFLIASRLSWKKTLALAIIIEVILAFWIRDNLSLNILMLLYPIKAIKTWQMGV